MSSCYAGCAARAAAAVAPRRQYIEWVFLYGMRWCSDWLATIRVSVSHTYDLNIRMGSLMRVCRCSYYDYMPVADDDEFRSYCPIPIAVVSIFSILFISRCCWRAESQNLCGENEKKHGTLEGSWVCAYLFLSIQSVWWHFRIMNGECN